MREVQLKKAVDKFLEKFQAHYAKLRKGEREMRLTAKASAKVPQLDQLRPIDLSNCIRELLDGAVEEFAREIEMDADGVAGTLVSYANANGFVAKVEIPSSADNNEKLFGLKADGNIIILPSQRSFDTTEKPAEKKKEKGA
jgi:hypothetical protein